MAEDPEVASSLNASDELETVEENNKCVKLDLPAHIAAFLKRQDLNRDFQQIICDQSLLENVAANYVIVKKILSFLQWQDKLLCKNVCSMWRSAVHTLQKEQMGPSDFAINLRLVHLKNGVKLMQSDCFYTEPLVVLAFANMGGFCVSAKCEILLPCPCDPACDKEHYRECLAILGSQATGKSSVLNMCAGNLVMTRGKAIIQRQHIRINRLQYIHKISLTSSGGGLDDFMTGHQNLMFIAQLKGYSVNKAHRMSAMALRHMGLHVDDTVVSAYSSGSRRRLCLCNTMVLAPTVAFLDEPMRALDHFYKPLVAKALQRLMAEPATVVVAETSVDWRLLQSVITRIAIMSKGQFAAIGPAEQILQSVAKGYTARIKLRLVTAYRKDKYRVYVDDEESSDFLDVVKNLVVAPKSCMLGVKACYTSYMPLRDSVTYKHCVSMKFGRASAFIGGLYIPVIPNVEFHVINIKSLDDIPGTFIKTVDKLAETRYVKGALVFVNESFILHSVEDIVFLNYLKDVQPDVPYALGGCLVEDTVSDNEDMNFMIEAVNASKVPMSENIVSIGLFTVPKNLNSQADACNFDVFSLILESHDWSKAKVETAINEFARKVPHFTHSVVIKMSCVGRDSKHEFEQNFFRTAFPNTRLVGCYGNGELGINRPERPPPEPRSSNVKRQRAESPQYGLMYSYSTVFVYIGWGNIVTPGETA
uniref:ABC transporter domain-containing protein n=1 Tax=Heliothis virescens TaxID=7102 RepID=A0A2A4K2U2_HELVI